MTTSQDSDYLQSLKANLNSMLSDPMARLANIAFRLETLQDRGDSVLPSQDAVAFRENLRALIKGADRCRELLMQSLDQVEDIRYVGQEEFFE